MNINVNTESVMPLKITDMVHEELRPYSTNRRGAPWKYNVENIVEVFLFRLKTALPLRAIAALFSFH